jgi:hypothetical protein
MPRPASRSYPPEKVAAYVADHTAAPAQPLELLTEALAEAGARITGAGIDWFVERSRSGTGLDERRARLAARGIVERLVGERPAERRRVTRDGLVKASAKCRVEPWC